MSNTSTTTQATADRLISLTRQEGVNRMSDSLQGIIGAILQALEADGIYQAERSGLPCSILSAETIGRAFRIFRHPPISMSPPNTSLRYQHVVTDMAMLSLLKDLPEEMWRQYLNKELLLGLSYKYTIRMHVNGDNRRSEELNTVLADYGYYPFATDDYTDALPRWELVWEVSLVARSRVMLNPNIRYQQYV